LLVALAIQSERSFKFIPQENSLVAHM